MSFRDAEGHLESIVASCTDVGGVDPFVEIAAGRSFFRYEDLVRLAARSPAPGLALFRQKGMIAWMRAWSTCMPNTVTEVISPAVAIPSCPQDIRAQLAVLLAGLILSQQLEVTP